MFRALALALTFASVQASALVIKQIKYPNSFPGYIKVVVQPVTATTSETDLLFLIDDSGSMSTYQQLMAANIPTLIQEIVKRVGGSINAAVITTDMDGMSGTGMGKFNGAPTVLNSSMTGFEAALSNRLMVGNAGSGTEKHLDALNAAMTEPLLSTHNAGFIRPNAHLAVIMLSDAEDQSTIAPDQVVQTLTQLKGAGGVSAYGFLIPSGAPAKADCSRDDGVTGPLRLESFLNALGGQEYNMCDTDWQTPLLKTAGQIVTQITRTVRLPTEPVVTTIEVTYGSSKLVAGDMQNGWVYDAKTMSVVVGPGFDFSKQAADLEIKFVPKYWQ